MAVRKGYRVTHSTFRTTAVFPSPTTTFGAMTARGLRRIVVVVCICAIAGMIVSSIIDNTGAAITFGLVAAAAVVCLILVTATAAPGAFGARVVDEEAASDVEHRVQALAAAGADEPELRALVRAARRMERRNQTG
jgi:hypothetical protein